MTYDGLTNENVLAQWLDARKRLEAIKLQEMDLRKEVTKRAFPNPSEGTQRFPIGSGWQLKLVHKLNYKLDDNDKVTAALARMKLAGNEGSFIADRLIGWTPKLSVSEYRDVQQRALDGDGTCRVIEKELQSVLTTSDAAPTLELEEPKK